MSPGEVWTIVLAIWAGGAGGWLLWYLFDWLRRRA